MDGSIKSVADLRGKKLACAEATPSHYFALYALTQGGLTNRDVQVGVHDLGGGGGQRLQGGQGGRGGVLVARRLHRGPRAAGGEDPGQHPRGVSNLIADIFVARGDFIEQHPEDVRRFVAGWLKGVDLANANPDKTAALLAKSFSGIGLEDAKGMLRGREAPDLRREPRLLLRRGRARQLQRASTRRPRASGGASARSSDVFEPYQTVDTRFLEAAAEFFPRPPAAAKPEFEFKTPPKPAAAPILTKTVSVYFPTGSSTLDENAKAVLDTQVVDLAATFGSAYLRIAGNTDNVGGRDANVRLSRARADAVAAASSSSKGFERNKFDVVGNGPDKPVATQRHRRRAGPRTGGRTSKSSRGEH